MAREEKIERTPAYVFARILFGLMLHTVYPARYHGLDKARELDAPYIMIANHRCFIDPFAIAIPIRRYEVRFLGKRELANSKFFNWLFDKWHMIKVTRHGTDMAAMRQSLQTLREGRVLGIFPEGTRRQPEMMREVESGAALIALRAKAPVLPVYIHGKFRPFRVTDVYYGTPMPLDDLYAQGVNNDAVNALCGRIRDTFYAMREQAQRRNNQKIAP